MIGELWLIYYRDLNYEWCLVVGVEMPEFLLEHFTVELKILLVFRLE